MAWIAEFKSDSNLWAVVILTWFLGDLFTTAFGTQIGLREGNPIAHTALTQYGLIGLFGLKTGFTALSYGWYRLIPSEYAVGIPIGLASLGILLTGLNLLTISAAI